MFGGLFASARLSNGLHFATCLATMMLTAGLVFSSVAQPWMQPFWLLPTLTWAAVRFSWVGVVAAMTILLVFDLLGSNPYIQRIADPLTAWLVLQQAILVGGGMAAALAYVVSVKHRQTTRLGELIATLDLGIFMTRELKGRIRFWSHGAERLYGFTSKEAVGRISHDLLHTVHPIPLAQIEHAVMTVGEWTGDLGHVTKDGRHLIVVARKVRRDFTNGHIITLLEVIHDVTVERGDQAKLAELNRTLEQRIEAEIAIRERTLERVKQTHHMHALGKLAAGVAHEFNNILQAVTGCMDLISQRPDDVERVTRFGRIAQNAVGRGSIITSRLLGFARRATFRAERIEPGLVLDALRDVLAHTLGGKVAVYLDLAPMLPAMMLDRSELETALINLATNARDAMPNGGAVALSVQVDVDPVALPAGRYLRIAVKDQGLGMDADTLRRATEPFFTTKDIGNGTGLGLSMVKGFAEQLGGALAIDSAPGAGTTVTVWLPVIEPPEQPNPQPLAPAAIPADPKPGARVLLVDDEPMVRETLAVGLESAGFCVLPAQSGAEALALLDTGEAVDVLVTDFAMPGMDGLSLIRAVRQRRPTLPAMILTGYVESVGSDATDFSLAGVLSILRKPINTRQLAGNINAILLLTPNAPDPTDGDHGG
jgi:PAS domain S-box-containing protein